MLEDEPLFKKFLNYLLLYLTSQYDIKINSVLIILLSIADRVLNNIININCHCSDAYVVIDVINLNN